MAPPKAVWELLKEFLLLRIAASYYFNLLHLSLPITLINQLLILYSHSLTSVQAAYDEPAIVLALAEDKCVACCSHLSLCFLMVPRCNKTQRDSD